MAGLNSGLAPNVVKTALDKVFMTEFNENVPGFATALDPMVFMQDTADGKSAVITEQFAGSGYWSTRAEQADLAAGTVRVGNQQTHQVLNYAQQIDISKNFFDDDQHSVVKKMTRQFARNARLTRDRYAFERFNLGFTTITSNNAVALFSASQTLLGSGGTTSNLVSGALSDTTLETAITALVEQLTQDGTAGGHHPACLLVPTALFKEASVLVDTEARPSTTNNDINYISRKYPDLQVKQSRFLGATNGLNGSDTAWFLLSGDHSMMRWERQAVVTDLVDYKHQRNNNYIYKGEFREVVAPISWEGLVGSTGV